MMEQYGEEAIRIVKWPGVSQASGTKLLSLRLQLSASSNYRPSPAKTKLSVSRAETGILVAPQR
jgi:hypothetical protein